MAVEYVDLALKGIPKELADILLDQKRAEVVFRGLKKKFRKFSKFAVEQLGSSESEEVQKALAESADKILKGLGNSDKAIQDLAGMFKKFTPEDLRKELHKLNFGYLKIDKTLQGMASQMPQLVKQMAGMQCIQWINIGLTAADLAATVACTVIICQKLNEMNGRLDAIAGKIDGIRKRQDEFYIRKPLRELLSEYKDISGDFEKGREVSAARIKKAIRECRSLMLCVMDLSDMPVDDLLEILYALMPVFTSLILLYYENYYDEIGGTDNLHDEWMDVYCTLDRKEFRDSLRAYYMIDQRKHNREVNDLLDCQQLFGINQRLQIEDLLTDLRECGGSKAYQQIQLLADQILRQEANQFKLDLTSECDPEKASAIVEEALGQVMTA